MKTNAESPSILALDPATQTGWAHSNARSGSFSIARPNQPEGRKYIDLIGFLEHSRERWGMDWLAYEDATFGTPHAHVKVFHAKIQAILLYFAALHGIRTIAVKPTELKQIATGHGRATKEQMKRAAKVQLGVEVVDDNQADALFVLECAKLEIANRARGTSKPKRSGRTGKRGANKAPKSLF